MKKAIFLSLFFLPLFAAESSSRPSAPPIDQDTLVAFIAPLSNEVLKDVLTLYDLDLIKYKNNDYYYDAATKQNLNPLLFGPKTAETEQTLREQLSTAFEHAWQSNPPTDNRIVMLKDDIKSVMINFFIENELYRILEVCYCITPSKRIAFAVLAAQQIMQKFPDRNQKIIVTAFASGLLLQEYLLLKLLIDHGYTHVTANFVDFGYPDPVMFRRILNHLEQSNPEAERIELKHYKQELLRASSIIEEPEPADTQEESSRAESSSQPGSSQEGSSSDEASQDEITSGEEMPVDGQSELEKPHAKSSKELRREWIQKNKELFPEFAHLFGNDYFGSPLTYQKAFDRVQKLLPHVTLHSYTSAHNYIDFVRRYRNEKADVLWMMDPDLTVFDVAPFPSQANLLGLVFADESNKKDAAPALFITLAKDLPVQLYVDKDAFEHDELLKEDIEKIRKKIIKTGSGTKLSYRFRDWLILTFGSAGSMPQIQELLATNKALLENAQQAPLSPAELQKIIAELESVHEHMLNIVEDDVEGTELPVFASEHATAETALDYINALQGWLYIPMQDIFKLVWYSDPHLAFQELVKETAKDDALIYLYYKYNTPGSRIKVRFEEETKPAYINKDVFGPIVGIKLLKEGIYSSNDSNETEEDGHTSGFGSPHHLYALVDPESGNLITWDDVKHALPEEHQSVAELMQETPVSVADDPYYPGKKSLNLSAYDIDSLEGLEAIPDIEKVQQLYLNDNYVKEIPPHAFSKFTNLETVFLNNNPLEYIADDAFEGLSHLKEISTHETKLSGEELQKIEQFIPSADLISQQATIPEVSVDIQGRKSLFIFPNMIQSLEDLNNIPGIEEVQDLFLTDIHFETIPPRAFSHLTNLEYITLDYNPSLSESAFEGLNNFNVISIKGMPSIEERNHIISSFPQRVTVFFHE